MLVGLTLNDRYTLDRRLESGGQAEIYLGHDLREPRDVVAKISRLFPEVDSGSPQENRTRIAFGSILSEAAILDLLAGVPFTPRVYDSGTLPPTEDGQDPRSYFITDLLGPSLQKARTETDLGMANILTAIYRVAQVLIHVHQAGFVHHDVKPENILLERTFHPEQPYNGKFFLVDFGTTRPEAHFSISIVGTPQYMDPAHITSGFSDPHNDVYSLGVTLFESVTNGPPFFSLDTETLFKGHVFIEPRFEPGLWGKHPPKVGDLVKRCLVKSLDARPSASQVAQELSEILNKYYC